MMKIQRSVSTPIRVAASWEERWNGADQGLIACWERGRDKKEEDPSLAIKALNGQLVLLPWKGGVEKALKKKQKYGSLNYLAMWQGLRGEDLNIDTEDEFALICSVSDMTVIFTNDLAKYGEL